MSVSEQALSSPLQTLTVIQCVAATLYAHVLCTTFTTAMQLVLRRRFCAASIIFIVNACAGVVLCATEILFAAPRSSPSSPEFPLVPSALCNWSFRAAMTSRALVYFCVAVFTALRFYALQGRNIAVLLVVLLLGSVSPLMNIWVVAFDDVKLSLNGTNSRCVAFDRFGVSSSLRIAETASVAFPLVSSSATVLLETVILIVTWRKAISIQLVLKTRGSHVGVSYVLLRDGTLLYVSMMIEAVIGIPHIPWVAIHLYTLADVLVSLCLLHFILSLRAIYLPYGADATAGSPQALRLDLSRIVGNLGAPIEHGLVIALSPEGEGIDEHQVSDSDPMAAGVLCDFGHKPTDPRTSTVEV